MAKLKKNNDVAKAILAGVEGNGISPLSEEGAGVVRLAVEAPDPALSRWDFAITTPFANDGEYVNIPATSPSEDLNVATGFTKAYSQPLDQGGKAVPREGINGIFNRVEKALQEVQNKVVTSVNDLLPDASGNVELLIETDSVKSVDDVLPDKNGNVPLNAVLAVNSIPPTTKTTKTETWTVTSKADGDWIAFAILSDGSILAGNNGTQGILKSTDNGKTWAVTGQASGNWRAFAVLSDGSILAGNHDNRGIWKSTDNGQTWIVTSKTSESWRAFAVLSDGSILVGSYSSQGIWKSTDGGQTWVVTSQTSGDWLAFAVLLDGSILAGKFDNQGIWKSTDNGQTWTTTSKADGSWLAFAVLSDGSVLAGSNGTQGIWESKNNGNTWEVTGQTTGSWIDFAVLSDGSILAGGNTNQGIWKSTDNGQTWAVTSKTNGGWRAFAVLSSGIVLGGSVDQGIWRMTTATTVVKGNVDVRPSLYDYKFYNLPVQTESGHLGISRFSTWLEETQVDYLSDPDLLSLGKVIFFNFSGSVSSLEAGDGNRELNIPLGNYAVINGLYSFATYNTGRNIQTGQSAIQGMLLNGTNLRLDFTTAAVTPSSNASFSGRMLLDTSLRPMPPKNVTATVVNNQVTLNWDNATRTIEEIL